MRLSFFLCIYPFRLFMHPFNHLSIHLSTDMLVQLLDLPDELNEISDMNSSAFLGAPLSSSNNIDSQTVNMGQLGNPGDLATPPLNNMSNSATPPPNIGISNQLNSHVLGNSTPPPNAVISTSGDPTPPLPSVSASPTHSISVPSSSSLMAPSASIGSPYHHMTNNTMYNHGNHMTTPPGMMAGQMDGRLPGYAQGPQRPYNPNVGIGTQRMVSRFPTPHMNPHVPHQTPPPHLMNQHPVDPRFSVVQPQQVHTNPVNMMPHPPNPGTMPQMSSVNRPPMPGPGAVGLSSEQPPQQQQV